MKTGAAPRVVSQFRARLRSSHSLLMLAADLLVLAGTTLATLALPAREDPDSRIFSLWVATAVFLLPVAWDYDLTLMLIPFSQLAVVAARGEASRRAIAMAVLSYALLIWWETSH
jgi:energy-converting hydrogenase Eha subunit E